MSLSFLEKTQITMAKTFFDLKVISFQNKSKNWFNHIYDPFFWYSTKDLKILSLIQYS